MITYDKAKQLFTYDPTTGRLSWRTSSARRIKVGQLAGCINNHGYRIIRVRGRLFLAHRIAWLLHYGYSPENEIDHINRDRTDNAIKNLREVSSSCNKRNCGLRVDNSSGVKGVSFSPNSNKWVAYITHNKIYSTLGSYRDYDDAICARFAAEQCLGWSECDTLSTAQKYVANKIVNNPTIRRSNGISQ